MRSSLVTLARWSGLVVAACAVVGCAAVAENVWVRPGENRPVSCLGIQYQFGPFGEWRVDRDVSIYARILEGHAPVLLEFNGVGSCGVSATGVENKGLREASHVLLLRSSTRKANVEPTVIALLVDVELLERSSNEIVFRALADAPVAPTEASVSKLLAEALNSLSRAGFVSIPKHRLRYETEIYRGSVIN